MPGCLERESSRPTCRCPGEASHRPVYDPAPRAPPGFPAPGDALFPATRAGGREPDTRVTVMPAVPKASLLARPMHDPCDACTRSSRLPRKKTFSSVHRSTPPAPLYTPAPSARVHAAPDNFYSLFYQIAASLVLLPQPHPHRPSPQDGRSLQACSRSSRGSRVYGVCEKVIARPESPSEGLGSRAWRINNARGPRGLMLTLCTGVANDAAFIAHITSR